MPRMLSFFAAISFALFGASALAANPEVELDTLARDGFDPAGIADPLFVANEGSSAYVALDGDMYAAISAGSIRL